MTMSVGLAKIITDPTAGVLTRKALGALSTPGLLVHDTGLSIDGDGRIIIKLAPDGGLLQDATGLYLEVTVGIDSHVDLNSADHDRDWNARLTGNAPNYIAGAVGIGTEALDAGRPLTSFDYSVGEVAGVDDTTVKLNIIYATGAQLRVGTDEDNFLAIRTFTEGFTRIYAVGTREPVVHLICGDGTQTGVSGGLQINYGTIIEQVLVLTGTWSFPGGGVLGATSWAEVTFVPTSLPSQFSFYLDKDYVTVNTINVGAEWIGYTARISTTNTITIRVSWFDVTAAGTTTWRMMVHRVTKFNGF